MSYTVRSDPALMHPNVTVRVILPTSAPTPSPPPVVITDDTDVWAMNGPPPETPPAGCGDGDVWIDVASGDVYVLDQP